MDLPTVLYRCPGPHSRGGGTWDYLGVETEAAHKAAIAAGWHPTMPAAIDAFEGKKAAVIAEVEKEFEAEVQVEEVVPTAEPDIAEEPALVAIEAAAPVARVRGKPGPKPKHRG